MNNLVKNLLGTSLFLFSSFEAAYSECIQDKSATKNKVIRCENIDYNVSVPESCVEGSCPLVMDVHGWTMTAKDQEKNTGLAKLGQENGFITIQPNAPRKNWSSDHYPSVYNFLKEAIDVWNVDRSRIHMTGFSQGAMMTWHFICSYSDLIASAAPIGYHNPKEGCHGENKLNPKISILYHTGISDRLASISDARSYSEIIKEAMGFELEDEIDARKYNWKYYKNEDGVDFQYVEHDYYTGLLFGRGHCFPGPANGYNKYGCRQRSDYLWGEKVMNFFASHPKLQSDD